MTNHSAFPLSPQTHHQSSPKAGSPSAFLLDKAWARRPSLCLTVFDPKYALTQMPPPFPVISSFKSVSERKTLEHTSRKYWQIHWRKPAPCEAGQKKQLNRYKEIQCARIYVKDTHLSRSITLRLSGSGPWNGWLRLHPLLLIGWEIWQSFYHLVTWQIASGRQLPETKKLLTK